jgi:nucleotide-binding universal stress UspA family protein
MAINKEKLTAKLDMLFRMLELVDRLQNEELSAIVTTAGIKVIHETRNEGQVILKTNDHDIQAAADMIVEKFTHLSDKINATLLSGLPLTIIMGQAELERIAGIGNLAEEVIKLYEKPVILMPYDSK